MGVGLRVRRSPVPGCHPPITPIAPRLPPVTSLCATDEWGNAMTRRLAAPATAVMVAAATVSVAAIRLLWQAPADVVTAASQGDLMQFWGALVGAVADLLAALLQYV